jgi:hypothetical protein
LVAEVGEGSESGPSSPAEIKAGQCKLRTLCHDLQGRDDLQIAAVLAVRTSLVRGFMQPRGRQRSRPLIAQIPSTAGHGRQRWAIPATPWN